MDFSPYFIKLLQSAREAAKAGEVPVSALVLYKGEILAIDHNKKETTHDPSAHAERLALSGAAFARRDWRLSEAVLLSTMEPCSMCTGTILQTRIRDVYYLCHDHKFGALGSVQCLHRDNGLNHSFNAHYMGDTYPDLKAEYVDMLAQFFLNLRTK